MDYTDVLDVLCAQVTRDLFAIAKFLFTVFNIRRWAFYTIYIVTYQRATLQRP